MNLLSTKRKSKLENAMLLLENAHGLIKHKLFKVLDVDYKSFQKLLQVLLDCNFLENTQKTSKLSIKTSTPRFALSSNPKKVSHSYYTITDRGKRFLNLYHEMMAMLRIKRGRVHVHPTTEK